MDKKEAFTAYAHRKRIEYLNSVWKINAIKIWLDDKNVAHYSFELIPVGRASTMITAPIDKCKIWEGK